jgi:hypothetical protein
MEQTIITWNAANWITVLIMATLGFMVLGMVAQIVRSKKAA